MKVPNLAFARPSLLMRLVMLVMRLDPNSLKSHNLPRWRRKFMNRAGPKPASLPGGLRRHCQVTVRLVEGQRVFELIPKSAQPATHIVYTHGGAYINPMHPAHWWIIGQLIAKTGASITVPMYPLAPEHTYRDAFPMLETVYRQVLEEHADKRIVLCGDSAGGALALAQALRYRELGLRLPDRLLLFAPWLDLTMSNPEAAAIEADDVLLSLDSLHEAAQHWAGGDDPCQPLLSPLNADLRGLPPITLFQGTADVLAPDGREFCARAARAGADITLHEYGSAFHVFMAAFFTREGTDVFKRIATLLAAAEAGGDRAAAVSMYGRS